MSTGQSPTLTVEEWEVRLRDWSKPPTDTEETRCENAVAVVRNAIKRYEPLQGRNIQIFAQGSYASGTNVKAYSDVDVCVRCMDVCFSTLPDGMTFQDVGLVDADYTYSAFKADVLAALRSYLGSSAATRRNKCIELHENTYRIDADVVPTFEHRRYRRDWRGQLGYLSGTEIRPDSGGRIINWPHQNSENNTTKNKVTGLRYKRMVRVLKRLKEEMAEQGSPAAKPVASYLIECLVWNVPNEKLGASEYIADLRSILAYLFHKTKSEAPCSEWGEVNELKYLFRGGQAWTREQANAFILAAWNHVGVL